MARVVGGKKAVQQNPRILGEDIITLGVEGLGIAVTAVFGDRITTPLVRQVIPGSQDENGVIGKVVDAGATFATAWLAGEAVGMVHSRYGGLIKRGGVLLGVAKLAGAVVPGYTLNSLPLAIPSPFAQKQIEGKGAPVQNLATVRSVGRSGL